MVCLFLFEVLIGMEGVGFVDVINDLEVGGESVRVLGSFVEYD